MIIKLKEIDLEKITREEIDNNPKNVDTKKFIDYIKERLTIAYDLIDSKIESFSAKELYADLKVIFDIEIEPKDYMRVLSSKYDRHYTDIINVKTYMVDKEGNNIELLGISTKDKSRYDDSRLTLGELRKLTNNSDFLVVGENSTKDKIGHREKYEKYKFIDDEINIYDKNIDVKGELFLGLVEILKHDFLVKNILYSLKLYINELEYQAKTIADLSKVKHNPPLAAIGRKYENALNELYKELPKPSSKEIHVRMHQKVKYGGKYK